MLIEKQPGANWLDLQQRVAAILKESGLSTEVAKPLKIARGTVEVDVYAVDPTTTPAAVYLCECKRWASNVPQSEVQAFRTVVADAGAHFGLFISARGFQAGSYDVVLHTNVHLFDWAQFQELFAERWCRRYWIPTFRSEASALATYVEPVSSDAGSRFERGKRIEEAEAVGLFCLDMWGSPFDGVAELMLGRPEPVARAITEHRDRYSPYLPENIGNAQYLRDLLKAMSDFARGWEHDHRRLRQG